MTAHLMILVYLEMSICLRIDLNMAVFKVIEYMIYRSKNEFVYVNRLSLTVIILGYSITKCRHSSAARYIYCCYK